MQEILLKFRFHNQIPTLADADALGHLIAKFISPDINLSPKPILDGSGNVKLPALDNHSMGTVFEELIRRFNEENNEEAGEHFTPRDVVRLMAGLIFTPIADRIESGTYLVYDGACGTGGMLTVAEETLLELAHKQGEEVSIHLYGQEVNPETYAITRADLLIKGQGEESENMKFGSTLSNDGFPAQTFDFMLSNPPYGKSWKLDLDRRWGGDRKDLRDPRFIVQHEDNPEFSLVTRSSDGQMMFLANKLSKMKPVTEQSPLGSRIAEVHNGSSLFTGDAGQGESNIRRWIIENDWLEAIIALPLNMFYNTGIATYIWVLTNNKPDHRKGKVQLIDATAAYRPLRKNLGKKNCEFGEEHLQRITDAYLRFHETDEAAEAQPDAVRSKIFPNAAFGYWKITVERPLRLRTQFTRKAIEGLRFASGDEEWRRRLYEQFGTGLYENFGKLRKQIEALLTQPDPAAEPDAESEGESGETRPKIPERTRKRLLSEITWDRDRRLVESARKLADHMGYDPFPDHNEFREKLDAALKTLRIKLTASERKTLIAAISSRDPESPPIVKKSNKYGTAVEYEPDPDLRDTEQVPFLEDGGIKAFFQREVLPYAPDAWIDTTKTKIGYEISFTRYFYKPQPLRTLDEIKADILAVEKESEGLLEQIIGGGSRI